MISGDLTSIMIMDKVSGASRELATKGGEDVNIDLGGYTSEYQINGNGSGHSKLNAKPWTVDGVNVEADTGVLEFLQGTINSLGESIFTLAFINGDTYKGTGKIDGDLKQNKNTGYVSFTVKGSGKMEKTS
jgi:hypothetical protein